MRTFVTGFFRFVLRVFFRRIEIVGEERVPLTGPALFVLNHTNALIDPLMVLCLIPRPVSFLAKSTLFRTPFVGFIVRAFGSIPVYRRLETGPGQERNRETFEFTRRHLGQGGAIAIFPEGTSHSDPRLRPLKTGAARIALSGNFGEPLKIVPVGLYYTAKGRFRSEAMIRFADPIEVGPPKDVREEPDPEEVRGLTTRLRAALSAVTLEGEEVELLQVAEKALALFPESSRRSLSDAFRLQKRLIEGYRALREKRPAEIRKLKTRIFRHTALLESLGIASVDEIPAVHYEWRRVLRDAAAELFSFILVFPAAFLGTLIHYPAYKSVDLLAVRIAKTEVDLLSTVKVIAAMLCYPVSWIAAGLLAGELLGPSAGVLLFVFAPFLGLVTLFFAERLRRLALAGRVFYLYLRRRTFLDRLRREGSAIEETLRLFGNELGSG